MEDESGVVVFCVIVEASRDRTIKIKIKKMKIQIQIKTTNNVNGPDSP